MHFDIPADQAPGVYVGKIKAYDKNTGDEASVEVTVKAYPRLTASKSSLEFGLEDDEKQEISFTLRNSGNAKVNDIAVSHDFSESDLEDDDNDDIKIEISPEKIDSLDVGESVTVKVKVDVENGFDFDEIEGHVLVESGNAESLSIPMTIVVEPAQCKVGEIGDLDMEVKEPDDGDEFEAGEKISVRVNIENNADDDMKVKLEAYLYNVDRGRELDSYKTTKKIDEDDDYTFEFELEMPDDVDEDDEYAIYVKAYEKSNEDEQCIAEKVDIEAKEIRDLLEIKSFSVTPLSVEGGDVIEGVVYIENEGANDQDDVKVTFKNYALGLNEQVGEGVISLEKSGKEGDSQIVRFVHQIPEKANSGSYPITVIVEYAGKSIESKVYITVLRSEVTEEATTEETTTESDVGGGVEVSYEKKGLWDSIRSRDTSTLFWVLVDVILVLAILVFLAVALRKR